MTAGWRPQTVLGIDPSLTSLGLAGVDLRTGVIQTQAVRSSLRGHARRRYLERKVRLVAAGYDLVAIEALSLGNNRPGHHEVTGLWYMIRTALWDIAVPVAEVSPATRAKYATGKGSGPGAAKPLVTAATRGLWPQHPLRTSDEADALLLAAIGARVAGVPFDPNPGPERFAPVNGIRIERPEYG